MAEISELANQAEIGNAAYIAREAARFAFESRGLVVTGAERGASVYDFYVVSRPDIPQPLVVREAGAALYLLFPSVIPDALPGNVVPLLLALIDLFVRDGDRSRSLSDLRQRLPSALQQLFDIMAAEVQRDVVRRGIGVV